MNQPMKALFHCAKAVSLKFVITGIAGMLFSLTVYSQPGKLSPAEEAAGYHIDTAVRIPVSDGIKLAGLLVYPRKQQGPFPVVLMVSCYPYEEDYDKKRSKAIADSGYAAVIVYTRGKEKSEGIFYPFEKDAADNYEIIDWISKQAWCNGRIGMYGGSYLGFTQWAAVKKLHPALKTIVPQVAVAPGIDFPNPNGIFLPYALQWLKYVRNKPYLDIAQMRPGNQWPAINEQYLLKGYAFNRLDSTEGHADSVFQRWLAHPAADSFWQRMTPTKEEFARLNIPVLTTSGYFDCDQRGALYYYRMHQQYGKAEAIASHHLFIGPFDHYGAQGGHIGSEMAGYKIDTAAMLSQQQLIMQWFNYTLRGGTKPAFLQNRVSVFVLGENKWHYFPSVDQMNSDTLCFYPQPKAKLSEKPEPDNVLTINWNTTALGYNNAAVAKTGGFYDHQLLQKKQLLLFRSDPFEKDIIVNGSLVVDLYLSLSVPDADLVVSCWEEDKKGKWLLLGQQAQRLSQSEDRAVRTTWIKDQVYHVRLTEIPWISTQVKKGSKLVVLVHPQVKNNFQLNYGSSKDVSIQTVQNGGEAMLQVYTGSRYPSRILLPVM